MKVIKFKTKAKLIYLIKRNFFLIDKKKKITWNKINMYILRILYFNKLREGFY